MNESNNDLNKEIHEDAVLNNAIRVLKTKKKLTRDILSMMDGEAVERKHNDSPDIIKTVNLTNNHKLFIGIEHFLVEQVSIN